MEDERVRPQFTFRAPKYFKMLFAISIIVYCELDMWRIELEKDAELERMKQEHIEDVYRQYNEYINRMYLEDRSIYEREVDSTSSDYEADSSLPLDRGRREKW